MHFQKKKFKFYIDKKKASIKKYTERKMEESKGCSHHKLDNCQSFV